MMAAAMMDRGSEGKRKRLRKVKSPVTCVLRKMGEAGGGG
jgi:hypothetical protein